MKFNLTNALIGGIFLSAAVSSIANSATVVHVPLFTIIKSGTAVGTVLAYQSYNQISPKVKVACSNQLGCTYTFENMIGMSCSFTPPVDSIIVLVDGKALPSIFSQHVFLFAQYPPSSGVATSHNSVSLKKGDHTFEVRLYEDSDNGLDPGCTLEDWEVDQTGYTP